MQPLISIIVPVYKVEKYLDRCVESIVNQTYKNLEIILVDDGSPDNCPKMCDEWAKRDSRIKVIHKENGGVSSARNIGIDAASGEYIGFVDSDDYIELNMYEILYSNIISSDCDIAVCNHQFDESNNNENKVRVVLADDILQALVQGGYKYGVLWNKLYKKSVVKDVRMPNFVCSEDLVFNYFVFKNAGKVAQSDVMLYHYIQNEDSTVHGEFCLGAFDAVKAVEIILNNERETKLYPYALKGFIESCFVVLYGVIKSNACMDKYDELRNKILCNKQEILKSNLYSKKDKIKVLILSASKPLYNFIIKKKG